MSDIRASEVILGGTSLYLLWQSLNKDRIIETKSEKILELEEAISLLKLPVPYSAGFLPKHRFVPSDLESILDPNANIDGIRNFFEFYYIMPLVIKIREAEIESNASDYNHYLSLLRQQGTSSG